MYTPVDCIALRTIRLSDSKNLLSAWTRSHGYVTFAMPAGASKEARRRRAITSPMMVFAGVTDFRPGKEILSVRDIRTSAPGVLPSPVKNMVAVFLSEALDRLLRSSEVDSALSEFLFSSADTFASLSSAADISAFSILFLFRLTYFLGIGPRLQGEGNIFDLREASFRSTPPLHHDFIDGKAAVIARALPRFAYTRGHRLPLDHAGRRRALDVILEYYAIHLDALGGIRSLEILRSLAD